MNKRIWALIFFFLLFIKFPAYSQGRIPIEPQYWANDEVYYTSYIHNRTALSIKQVNLKTNSINEYITPVLGENIKMSIGSEGNIFALRFLGIYLENKIKISKYSLYTLDKNQWKLVANYSGPSAINSMWQLEDGRWLALGYRIVYEGKNYPFGIFRIENGSQLVESGGIDWGFETSYWKDTNTLSSPQMGHLFVEPCIIRTTNYLTLASNRGPYFWIFKTLNGQLHRTSKLFSTMDEKEILGGNILLDGLLGIQPRKLGDILIASHSEKAIRNNEIIYNGNKFNSTIEWWLLDPESGSIRPSVRPDNTIVLLDNYIERKLFSFWRIKPDGNLEFLPLIEIEKKRSIKNN